MRIIIPLDAIMKTSSSSPTARLATTFPFSDESDIPITPCPALCLGLKLLNSVLLPNPYPVTTSSDFPSSARHAATTWSFSVSFIPLTPAAERPIGRTSFSWKRITFPFELIRQI